ncbi:CASP-like protein [Rhynchospora pubera]|uniref:CASP-like protein n=1 Tax=Rhynchospora pubera TaxID=906938 RepID=A0AAV8F523_9POAL|nr:CASP-like protein [Rhynchospora pubera]KAJ4779834.1 CASP-like protein [Rhynchospora pubera]KAJ4786744.1 CASP-like protein [Rhynchospora pubera]KAJ4807630.1 CASP-like protein [Rhynchospora pubera]
MPSPLRNGIGTNNMVAHMAMASPSPLRHHHHFMSTVSQRKMRRLNYLVLLFRIAAFSFSLASAVFTLSNSNSNNHSNSTSWLNFLSFRFLFAANAIVAIYSLFEMAASLWEILKGGSTLLPESAQLWFDFSHDQVFAYMALAAGVAGAAEAGRLKQGPTCQGDGQSFCIQADISVVLGFAGFLFLALATLSSGFRLICFLATGSRFPMM